jgi:hypothetical protein
MQPAGDRKWQLIYPVFHVAKASAISVNIAYGFTFSFAVEFANVNITN